MHFLKFVVFLGILTLTIGAKAEDLHEKPAGEVLHNSSDATATSMDSAHLNPLPCNFMPGLSVGDRLRELQCCNETVERYYRDWAIVSLPLTRFLETLRQWNCSQFQEQCNERTFAFTDYTELIYDYFCNYTLLIEKCLSRVVKTVLQRNTELGYSMNETLSKSSEQKLENTVNVMQTGNYFNDSNTWKKALSVLQPSQMTLEELLEPCIQVAQYDQEEIHDGSYQELVNFLVPSCQLSWCGFSAEAFQNHQISFWTCLSSKCHTGLSVLLAVLGIMALATTVLNFLVVLVLCKTPRLYNSQSIYKISLAVADILVGVFVLPTCMYTLSAFLWTPLTSSLEQNVSGYQEVNGTVVEVTRAIKKEIHQNLRNEKLNFAYLDFVGFMTSLSIFVSVYTLAGAGCDRLNAVYKPLNYERSRANKRAKIACVISWVIAAIFALMPIITQDSVFVYGVVFSLVVVSLEHQGVLLLVVVLFIPLVIVWIVNVSIYVVIKRHNNLQRRLTVTRKSKSHGTPNVERKLAATLRIMVGVFTINTLPLWIAILCNLFIPNISPSKPESLNPKAAADFITVQVVAALLLFGNSLCNFFIYNIRSEEFRKAFKQIIKEFLEKIGLTTCCRMSLAYIRQTTGYRKRNFSVSFGFLNIRKSSHTEETAIDKTVTTSRIRENSTVKSESDMNASTSNMKRHEPGEMLSVSDLNDSVFQSNASDWNKLPSPITKQFNDVIDVVNQPKDT